MSTTESNTESKVSKAKKSNAAKAKKRKNILETEYGKNVLTVNAKLKEMQRTTGGAIRLLINFRSDINLPANVVKFLKETQKDSDKYKAFDATVRRSKKGTTCPFYVLQAVNKALKDK